METEPTTFGVRDSFMDRLVRQVEQYLRGERREFDVELDLSDSTPFQRSVYEELLKIPYGQTRNYGDIAQRIENPKASRAVGGANNHNPIHIIIPCHRVVGSRGTLTGYAAGVAIKEKLINLEKRDVGD